jgi:hypothetical protein
VKSGAALSESCPSFMAEKKDEGLLNPTRVV